MSLLLLPVLLFAPLQEPAEHPSLRFGREAMAAGRHEEARDHFLYALARSPEPLAVVALLLENAQQDADARALWAHDWYALAADARGRAKPGKLAALMPEGDPHPAALAVARAEAVKELLRFRQVAARSKSAGAPLLVEWSEDLARTLAAAAPALLAADSEAMDPHIPVGRERMRAVIKALGAALRRPVGSGQEDFVVRAARVLRGLAAQAGFDSGYGPPAVDFDAEATSAASELGRRRAAMEQDETLRVWTVEELADLDPDEARSFTLGHASFARPGIATSPQDWYRVETTCGHGTLLGAAETVEDHHRRLVNWFGEDPFLGRPGTLRVVPESHGLEMEGAGFWWVGGFQGGDITTLKFTRGTIPGLGRGITHELTHRFDGAVYGGLPGWLAEGRAVWTAANYGFITDLEFVEDHVAFGTMRAVLGMGYGRQAELERLISGDLEDYRDNYSAGYALFVYLRSWYGPDEPEEADDEDAPEVEPTPWYAERLEKYMRGKERRRGDAVATFADFFADGKGGRPDGMEAFAADFADFLRGFDAREPAEWTARYDEKGPRGEEGALVFDEPTFSWLRARAEPWFGQDQARVAAELFADMEEPADAVEAMCWALAVDEPSDAALAMLAEQLDALGADEAAWVVRRWARFRSPSRDFQEPGPAPFLAALGGVTAYREALAGAAADYGAAGQPLSAAALTAEHDALAWALGLPALPTVDREALAAAHADALHPFDAPPRLMDLDGWTEDDLTGHEDARVAGLWYIDEDADVHVGRERPRTGTDTMDRNSRRRDAFVMSRAWQDPGRYRLRAKIEMTTAWLSGGIVVGWTRRDRAVRISFTGGDWRFAVGESDARQAVGQLGWNITGAYVMPERVSGSHRFAGDGSTFDLEVLVDGPTVELYLDGKREGAWTTLDARPVQGHIGFYTSTGAMRVVTPEIQRLDRTAWSPLGGAIGRGLHPVLAGETGWRALLQRPVSGLPLSPSGTLLVWFGEETTGKLAEAGVEGWQERVLTVLDKLVWAFEGEKPSQGITVVVPEAFPEEARTRLHAEFAPRVAGGFRVVSHRQGFELFENRWTVSGWATAMLGFVDPAGILRVADRLESVYNRLPRIIRDQLRTYQDHVRPGQAGAAE